MALLLLEPNFRWNRPPNPGLGQDCMDFDTYMESCAGGGTSACGTDPIADQACIQSQEAAVNACQAGWTSQPGNCHAPGTNVSYANGTVTEVSPSGAVSTATQNTVAATAYGNGYDQNGQPLSSFTDSGLPGPPIVVNSAPAKTPVGTPRTPAGSILVSSSAPPANKSSGASQSSGSTSGSGASQSSSSTSGSTSPVSPCDLAFF